MAVGFLDICCWPTWIGIMRSNSTKHHIKFLPGVSINLDIDTLLTSILISLKTIVCVYVDVSVYVHVYVQSSMLYLALTPKGNKIWYFSACLYFLFLFISFISFLPWGLLLISGKMTFTQPRSSWLKSL